MKNRLAAVVSLIAVLALVAPTASTALIDEKTSDASGSKADHRLTAALQRAPEGVSVIVTTDGRPEAAAANARALGARVTWVYDIIDAFAARMRPAVLDVIAARTDVARIHLDRKVGAVMDVSHRAIESDKGWASGHRGAGVSVAVIDTGIDTLHPWFAGAIAGCVSTIAGVVSPECTDSDGHGTHVAGTVASRDQEYPGVAPGASLAIVRVLHAAGAGTGSDIIAGMEWVKKNKDGVSPPIRVATMSIGFLDPGCGDGTGPEAEAANNLVSAGVFFSVAAGNSGHKECTIDGASTAAKVTTIAAVDDGGTVTQNDDKIAGFSSGGSKKNGKPDVSFPGVDITSAFIGAGSLIATMDGTSMATPHAAGTAALLIDSEPGLTATGVKDRITSTAVKTANTGNSFNHVYGHGLGNACRALRLSGCGMVSVPSAPTEVHVAGIEMAFKHVQSTAHQVSATVQVVDAANAGMEGATVSVQFTSPEGKGYTASGATGSTGVAAVSAKQRKAGHGTWKMCVTSVSGTNLSYNSTANVETCDSILVS